MKQKQILVFSIISILIIAYIFFTPVQLAGATQQGSNTAEASTPYGESIEIQIGSGSTTTGQASIIDVAKTSWQASYSDTDSQNVYDVDGTYKSQEQVTLSYSLSVTHSNVESITTTVKIKAIQNDTPTNYNEYILANTKTLTGTSPITDNDQTQRTISEHLATDIGAPASGATINYQIYCQVTATGTVSGETLTATVNYTEFGSLTYTRTSESSSAEVTPTVSVASIIEYKASAIDTTLGIPQGWTISTVAITCILVAAATVKQKWL